MHGVTKPGPASYFKKEYSQIGQLSLVLVNYLDKQWDRITDHIHVYWRQLKMPNSLSLISQRWYTKMNSHILLLYVEVGQYWKMTLIWYAGDALFRWRHTGSTYTWRHYASIPYDFNLKLHPVCAVNVLLNNEQILDNFYKQLCLREIILWNYDVILKTKCKIRLRNLPTFSFCLK